MGTRGLPKTPTEILRARGSYLADTRIDEPKPSKTRPKILPGFSSVVKQCWKWLTPQLEAMGILGKCDRNAMMRYCQVWAEWLALQKWLGTNKHFYGVEDKDGKIIDIREVPQVGRALKLSEHLLRLDTRERLLSVCRKNPERAFVLQGAFGEAGRN